MRRVLIGLSLLGLLFFGGAFAISWLDAPLVERGARELLRIEVERRVGERIDALSNTRIAGLAKRALGDADADVALTARAIRDQVPRKVAEVVSNMLDADCECRQRLRDDLQGWEERRLSSRVQVRDKLVGLIESSYASVARSLLREFRIFTATNALAFALLGLVTVLRGRAALQLLLPALVLVTATGITGGLYLLGQNWLHTIVFGQYVGMAYVAYLAGVALLLGDVAFNRARATTLALAALGSAMITVPC